MDQFFDQKNFVGLTYAPNRQVYRHLTQSSYPKKTLRQSLVDRKRAEKMIYQCFPCPREVGKPCFVGVETMYKLGRPMGEEEWGLYIVCTHGKQNVIDT